MDIIAISTRDIRFYISYSLTKSHPLFTTTTKPLQTLKSAPVPPDFCNFHLLTHFTQTPYHPKYHHNRERGY